MAIFFAIFLKNHNFVWKVLQICFFGGIGHIKVQFFHQNNSDSKATKHSFSHRFGVKSAFVWKSSEIH